MLKNIFFEIYRKINKLPKHVRIEACNLCQLNCRDCFMRLNPQDYSVGKGYLKFDDYKNFIIRHPFIKSVELSLCGEIFLNPELDKIIKFSHEREIYLTALNGVNFNSLSEEMLEMIVKYGVKAITISIDGACENTYSVYRRNGSFTKVIENIKKLNDYKKIYSSPYPILFWQYIYFKHNLNEVKQAVKLAQELDFKFICFINPWNKEVLKKEIIFETNSILLDRELKDILQYSHSPICKQVFIQPQINWDGRILGCCCATRTKGGENVFKSGLKKALNSKRIKLMKKVLIGKGEPNKETDYFYCNLYKKSNAEELKKLKV